MDHVCVNGVLLFIGSCSHGIVGKYWESSIDLPNITACKDVSWDSFLKRSINDCPPEKSVVFGEYVPTTYVHILSAIEMYFFEVC